MYEHALYTLLLSCACGLVRVCSSARALHYITIHHIRQYYLQTYIHTFNACMQTDTEREREREKREEERRGEKREEREKREKREEREVREEREERRERSERREKREK